MFGLKRQSHVDPVDQCDYQMESIWLDQMILARIEPAAFPHVVNPGYQTVCHSQLHPQFIRDVENAGGWGVDWDDLRAGMCYESFEVRDRHGRLRWCIAKTISIGRDPVLIDVSHREGSLVHTFIFPGPCPPGIDRNKLIKILPFAKSLQDVFERWNKAEEILRYRLDSWWWAQKGKNFLYWKHLQ